MDCPKGCTHVIRVNKEKVPIRMDYVKTRFTSYNWYKCPSCGWRVFEDK